MGNAVIIGILLVVGFFALRSAAKHFRGEGGCCGGGSVPRQKKSVRDVRFRKKLKIEGMHCENCKNSVEKAINAIDGAAARVDLGRGTALVKLDRPVEDAVLVEAVEKAGFHVSAVELA